MRVVQGQEFCMVHGTHSEVLKAAQDTLNGLTIIAVDTLERALVETDQKCSLCGHGYVTAQKLKAAGMVLDRTGLGPELNIKHTGKIDFTVMVERMTDDEFRAVDEIMTRVMERVAHETSLEKGQVT